MLVIIPALFLPNFVTYYSQNYAGITGSGLFNTRTFTSVVKIKPFIHTYVYHHNTVTIQN